MSLQPSKLAKKVQGAPVIIVRSQEIDHAGETGFTYQARQVMDTVIDNLARAIRKLASAGVERAVVSADTVISSSPRIETSRCAQTRQAVRPWTFTGVAGSVAAARPRRAVCGSRRPHSGTHPILSWFFRAPRAC
ncbi:MAG: hypothetical protein R3A48_04015 [Polyangiales bacterium]